MKWTILVGILGVGVGYLLGRGNGEAERVVDEGGEVVRSERRMGRSGGRSERSSGRKVTKEVVDGALSEFETYGRTSDLGRARLMKWVLELDASEFPEVMESLGRLNHLDPEGVMDPFGGTRSVDYVRLGLARWYELEGALALDWVVGNSAFSEKWDGDRLILDAIRDGYERDPGRAFELFNEHLLRADRSGEIERKRVVEWCYEIGKWSGDLERDWEAVTALRKELGFNEGDDEGPLGGGEPSFMSAMMDGMLASGRESELREVLGKGASEKLADLEEKQGNRKLKGLRNGGWEGLRAAIDSGEILPGSRETWTVLCDWGAQDREKAIAWYLDQSIEGMSREEQIREATLHGGFFRSYDAVGSELVSALEFLDQQEAMGESVEEAREGVVYYAESMGEFDPLLGLQGKVSSRLWELVTLKVGIEAMDTHVIRWEGAGEHLIFPEILDDKIELLERFGIRDEVFEKVRLRNEASLKELQRRLGAE